MAKYAINEELLQQLETMEMMIKNNVAGLFGGNHKAKTFGSSCEYADFRDYQAGDDISKIDWNAYSRTEELYLKQYLDERRLHTRIYIDASRSMDFNHSSKAEKALQIAAAFAYLSLVEMDKVSIYYIKNDEIHDVVLNMNGKDMFYQNISKLNEIEFDGEFCLSKAIRNSVVGYGDGLSVIVSDFLTENDYKSGIDYLVEKKRDVLLMQVLSNEELRPSTRGKIHFFDSEESQGSYKKNVTKDIIEAYHDALNFIINDLKDFIHSRQGEYLLVKEKDRITDVFLGNLVEEGVLK